MTHDFMVAIITIALMSIAAWAVHPFHLWNRVQALEKNKLDFAEAVRSIHSRIDGTVSLVNRMTDESTKSIQEVSRNLNVYHKSMKELVNTVDDKVNLLGEATVGAVNALGGTMDNVTAPTKEEE